MNYIPTPEEIKLAEAERKRKNLVKCEACGKCSMPDECAMGLCEACKLFYLDECGESEV